MLSAKTARKFNKIAVKTPSQKVELRDIWIETSSNQPLAATAKRTQDSSSDSSQMVMYVSGRVGPSNEVRLASVYQFPGDVATQSDSGSFVLELQASNGQILGASRFDPATPMDSEPGGAFHFFQRLVFHPDAVRLVLKENNNELTERTRSPNSPTLNIIEPSGNAVWKEGMQKIQWEASDTDADALLYTVQYSGDTGKTWRTLALNVTQTQMEVNVGQLPGGEGNAALVRVFGTDGFNGVVKTSEPFSVKDKAPYVRIQSPAEGTQIEQNRLIDFIGGAIDFEDGTLGDQSFQWQSHRDGNLGKGHELRLTNLSVGEHTIILTAQDQSGNVAQDTVLIEVSGHPNTQPIADAGLNQTGFVNTLLELDGRESFDPDGDSLSFFWRFVSSPNGMLSFPELENSKTATPSFMASVAGEYWLQLVVRDGQVNSFPSKVKVELQGQTFQYSAKIVCGEQKDARDKRLVMGVYATTVNVHNPHDFKIAFTKKLALSYPPGGQLPGKIFTVGTDTLTANGALQTDCVDLERRLFPGGFPTAYIEGYVLIESPVSLDVTAVYTSGKKGEVTSMDIEQVKERKTDKTK